ncbi:pilus assembly protein [Lichenihabitans sp. Uapishka_5]|uniref:TadE/TadG family type IV pilus assembly protein n=1 Tax=Lichenihabitans sp. Uapishka_5 TaxID=3037302 RepID=UPI0029E7CC16|nr:TadE/TadG family type IV pilus assembly protein [Lichenihabitans sp. Uapishka_5]MDX7953851.1 pilus assembly protein [Lichenihabitans sp. Uapishka_5]
MRWPGAVLRRFAACRAGVRAVEFACVLPIFLLLLMGGGEYTRALAISRKVTVTTRTVTDLTSRSTTVTESEIKAILAASTQVMAPFDASNLTIVLSEVTTDAAGTKTTVTWSRTLNGTALPEGSSFPLASGAGQAGASLIVGQVSYAYVPSFGSSFVAAMTLADTLYMNPRLSTTVAVSG